LKKLPDDPVEFAGTLSALLKTRNDQWQISNQVLTKLMGTGQRVGIDAGVVESRK